jgi:hypothetical protein
MSSEVLQPANSNKFPSTLLHSTAEFVPRFALLCMCFFYIRSSNITIFFFPNESLPLSKFRGNSGLRTQTSAQILNLFPLLYILTANLPSADVLHSPALYLTPSLFVPEEQVGITREHSQGQTSIYPCINSVFQHTLYFLFSFSSLNS